MRYSLAVLHALVALAVLLGFGCDGNGSSGSLLGIGEGCTRNSDCESNVCETGDPGGQCSKACTGPADCGTGNVCNPENKCYKACTTNADCREAEGYSCQGVAPDQFCDVAPAPMEVTVEATGDHFVPEHATIGVGGTIHWVNRDNHAHTATSGTSSSAADAGDLFDGNLAASGTFDFTFDTAGDQPYFCRIHEAFGMTGTITVTP